jgi:nucleotide-binding universal stress UspA family protein
VEYLLGSTHAGFIEFLEESADALDLEAVKRQFSDPSADLRQTVVEKLGIGPIAPRLDELDLGLLVLPPPADGWMTRSGFKGSGFLRRLQGLNVPTLVARGTHPYRRIMLAISDPELDSGATVLAIDIARMLDASLTVVVANPPDFVAGPRYAGSIDGALEGAVELARSYGLMAEVTRLTGNPVRRMLAASRKFDLAVVGWSRNDRTSFLRPRVEQSLVHQAPCSVLVLPD